MIGTHLFDLVRWLFDSEIVRLRAELDDNLDPRHRGTEFQDRTGRCEARLDNGVRVTMDLSGDIPRRQLWFVIGCEEGRLEVDERLGKVRLVGAGNRDWETDYVFPGTLDLGVARALFELVRGDRPRCDMRDGTAALEAAVACQLSAREQGRWVDLPLAGEIRTEEFPFA
jgi:predicted dehydrogenase